MGEWEFIIALLVTFWEGEKLIYTRRISEWWQQEERDFCEEKDNKLKVQTVEGHPEQWLGKFLGIVGQDPSDSESNRFTVHIFWFCFIHLRYILQIPLKWSVILWKSWTSTGQLFLKLGSFVTNYQFSLIITWEFEGNWELFNQ